MSVRARCPGRADAVRPAAGRTAVRGVFDLDGRLVDPLALPAGTRAHVLVFTTTDCPISNRYAPEIQRLAAAYR